MKTRQESSEETPSFEPKTDYKRILNEALKTKNFGKMPPESQVIVIYTNNCSIYSEIITKKKNYTVSERFWGVLISSNDTIIRNVICMWDDGRIDIPSSLFRMQLCNLNKINSGTEMILNGDEGYVYKKISDVDQRFANE